MNKQRLLRLADLLDAHRDNGVRFDLAMWLRKNKCDGDWCGTKACAVGLACLDPQFKGEGLNLDGCQPEFSGEFGWGAVQKFFELERGEDLYLFWYGAYDELPTGDSGARKVAGRIRKMVNEGPPPSERLEELIRGFF